MEFKTSSVRLLLPPARGLRGESDEIAGVDGYTTHRYISPVGVDDEVDCFVGWLMTYTDLYGRGTMPSKKPGRTGWQALPFVDDGLLLSSEFLRFRIEISASGG